MFQNSSGQQYPRGLCNILAELAYGHCVDSCLSSLVLPPDLDQFSQSVLVKFMYPCIHTKSLHKAMVLTPQLFSGSQAFAAPLFNGRREAHEGELFSACSQARNTVNMLAQLLGGVVVLDKHSCLRSHF